MATIYYTASSLDGFLADPQHSLDWLFQFPDDGDAEPDYVRFVAHVGALCMGSHTYEWIWRRHVGPDAPHPMPWPYSQPCWVFSTRELPRIPGANITFVQGDVRSVHEAMVRAASGQDVWVVGGGELAGLFADAGLLDELHVTFASVTLGAGMPLLPRRLVTPPLALIDVQRIGPEFVQVRYRVPRTSVGAHSP